MWTKLSKVLGKHARWYGITASSELNNLQKGKGETITAFWDRAADLQQTITTSGLKMDDDNFAMHIINALPEEYEYFKRSAEIDPDDFEIGIFKRKLLQEEAKIEADKHARRNSSGKAYWTRKSGSRSDSSEAKADSSERQKWMDYRDPKNTFAQRKQLDREPPQASGQRKFSPKTRGNCYRCNM